MAERNQKNKVTSGQNLGFAILIIIILALIVVNFGNITGKTVAQGNSDIKIVVEGRDYGSGLNTVQAGDNIYVSLTPGNNVKYYYQPKIVDELQSRILGAITVTTCGSWCSKKVPVQNQGIEASYKIPSYLAPGLYMVRVQYKAGEGDKIVEKSAVASFIVTASYN